MRTVVEIRGDRFYINGTPTYEGRQFNGWKIEGLLFNVRAVQAIFDDENPATRHRWTYPDTGQWDPERNVRELINALPSWREHGLLAFTVNLQGGMPVPRTEHDQPWINTAFDALGEFKSAYLDRLRQVLDAADRLGMVVIVGFFYFGQDERLTGADMVRNATKNAARWLVESGYRNVLIEIANECDVPLYQHELLHPGRIAELVELAQSVMPKDNPIPVSTSYAGGSLPNPEVLEIADYVLVHGNGQTPDDVRSMVRSIRSRPQYMKRPRPIVFNEDSVSVANLDAAVSEYASWGYYDQGTNNYQDGYQSPPVNWSINTAAKQQFFRRVALLSGSKRDIS